MGSLKNWINLLRSNRPLLFFLLFIFFSIYFLVLIGINLASGHLDVIVGGEKHIGFYPTDYAINDLLLIGVGLEVSIPEAYGSIIDETKKFPKLSINEYQYVLLNDSLKIERFCIDEVIVGDIDVWFSVEEPSYLEDDIIRGTVNVIQTPVPFCIDFPEVSEDGEWHTIKLTDPIEVEIFDQHNAKLYPFDRYDFPIAIQLRYSINTEISDTEGGIIQSKSIAPLIEIKFPWSLSWDLSFSEVKENNWTIKEDMLRIEIEPGGDVTIYPRSVQNLYEDNLEMKEGNYKIIGMIFKRPIFIQASFIFIIIFLIIMIALISLINKDSIFIEAVIAILFGLIGFKQILSPPDFSARTLLDIAILSLWLLLGLAVVIFLIRRFNRIRSLKNHWPGDDDLPSIEVLKSIKGVGSIIANNLLEEFGSLEDMQQATSEQIESVHRKITPELANRIKNRVDEHLLNLDNK